MSLEKTINSILRDHQMIDTGVSKAIADAIEPLIQETIHHELSVSQFAGMAMQGMLANPDMSDTGMKQISSISIEYAYDLMDGLYAERNKKRADAN